MLRGGVRVERSVDTVAIAHSFWTVDLPRSWADATPGLADVLARTASVDSLASGAPGVGGLLTFLRAQGCLSFPERGEYTLRDVGELFHDLSAVWYAEYYAHPVWAGIRAGSSSLNQLVAWLVHNYHLSRSAAMSASRSATRLARLDLRRVFAHSALEEYSHCEDYFFVRHPRLPLVDGDIQRSVHLPGNLAFDEQMLRMAEGDWLGHLLAALFQETTARFYEESRSFYSDVAVAYRLGDFFKDWERHIELDVNEDHANDFAGILDSDERIGKDQLLRSVQNAWLTFGCLLAGLDDVLGEERPDDRILLRAPIESAVIDADQTALLRPYREALPPGERRLIATTAMELHAGLWDAGLGSLRSDKPHEATSPLAADLEFLRVDVASSIYRALSHARTHEEIILLGRLAESATTTADLDRVGFGPASPPISHHTAALANFLRERASRPTEFAYLLHHLHTLETKRETYGAAGWLPFGKANAADIQEFLSGCRIDADATDRLINATLQLNELHDRWARRSSEATVRDFLRD